MCVCFSHVAWKTTPKSNSVPVSSWAKVRVRSCSLVKQWAQEFPFLVIVTGFVVGYTREEGERKRACWGWRRLNQALCLHLLWLIPISLPPAVALGVNEFAVQCCATFSSWLLRLKYQLQPIGTPAKVGEEFNVPIMWKLGHSREQCMAAKLFLALQPVIKQIQNSKQSFRGYLAINQVSHYY